ncbi:MAG: 4Fe-4S dicluster domain-containing protein [Desulfitobacterium hafniense]|nr:4Fe-4S dicluster domain-containing protein [Desulfitobacterium hafniense]
MSNQSMLIDLTSCIGCKACAVACKQENGLAAGNTFLKVWLKEYLKDKVVKYYVHQACHHCNAPRCQAACPVGAIERREDGVVVQDEDKCIGCQVCVTVCPYGGAKIMANGKAGKCSFCKHRLKSGVPSACVTVCPTQARIMGGREEIVREAERRKAELLGKGCSTRLEGINDIQTKVIYLLPE